MSFSIFSQEWQASEREMYVSFQNDSELDLDKLSSIISLDRIERNGIIKAYLNERSFNAFQKLNIDFKVLPHPSSLVDPVKMLHFPENRNRNDWNFYPDYESYLAMMNEFEEQFPDLCSVFSIGQSIEGREILIARISDNITASEGEAKVLYTSSMHGNELAGFNLSLRLIDHLLNAYGSDPEITAMVNDLDIWINPLANPDGAYAGGNHTVAGARRFNANGVDINRNFPDPEDGIHPDGNDWQQETEVFMRLAEENQFVLSANFHAGAELVNYPWDTWQELHVDDEWWYFIGREWADTIHQYAPADYFDAFDNGITNGYAWYSISGGRQDYMNFFHQCREFTLEMTDATLLPSELLDDHWEYNYRSMINYLNQARFGIKGKVVDRETQEAIYSKISIPNHDAEYSMVYSDQNSGSYFRPIFEGNYTLEITAPCYDTTLIEEVDVRNFQATIENVEMDPMGLYADFEAEFTSIEPGQKLSFYDQSCGQPIGWNWTFEGASPAESAQQNPEDILYPNPGLYNVSLQVNTRDQDHVQLKEEFILVAPRYMMRDTSSQDCFAYFLDSGDESGNYQNFEHSMITFFPENNSVRMTANFLSFDLEDDDDCKYDWLKIYDGPGTDANLIGTYCGKDNPGIIKSTHLSGALSFEFYSDQSVNHPGWSAIIECEDLTNNQSINLDDYIVFPNPANSQVYIRGKQMIHKVKVIDFAGRIINELNSESQQLTISTDNFKNGIYLFEIHSKDEIVRKKLFIRK